MLIYDPTGTCDKINANTESYKTEKDLLLNSDRLLSTKTTEIITGWEYRWF